MKKLVYILGFLALFLNSLQAQEVVADAKLDTTDILIGDQIKLNISFTMPLDSRVIWPFYKDTLTNGIEIISMTAVDTMINESENLVDMFQTITITSFDSGYYHIPPLKFQYQPIDDTGFMEVRSAPMYLQVYTMEVDTAQAIKAIKPPIGAPFSIREIMPWILLALASLIITFLIVYLVRKIKRKEPIFTIRPKPVLPPFVVAMNGLESLKEKKLWQSGKTKEFYTELTDIIRVYIEGRFNVAAVEMTSEEILQGMKSTDSPKETINKLGKTLVLADLVKFAKENPLPLENDNSLSNCMDFVNETRPAIDETNKEDEKQETSNQKQETSNQKQATEE